MERVENICTKFPLHISFGTTAKPKKKIETFLNQVQIVQNSCSKQSLIFFKLWLMKNGHFGHKISQLIDSCLLCVPPKILFFSGNRKHALFCDQCSICNGNDVTLPYNLVFLLFKQIVLNLLSKGLFKNIFLFLQVNIIVF